jgi:hypothetical protein
MDGIVSGLNIPITAETRLLMVFSATVTAGLDMALAIPGYMSGGMSIA